MTYSYEFDAHPLPYPSDFKRGFVQRVVDGDTYYIRVDEGFHVAITISVRLRGVNAPELATPDGQGVRDALVRMIEGRPVLVRTYKDQQSFARWIADVRFLLPDLTPGSLISIWTDLAQYLIGAGWAVPYP